MNTETTAAATATIDPPAVTEPEKTDAAPETTPAPGNVSDENVTLLSDPEGGTVTIATETLTDHPIVKQGVLDEGVQWQFEVTLNEAQGDGKPRKVKARVPIAQRGDHLNENRRWYPWDILKAEAVRLNERAKRGELLMEGEHRTKDGQNHRLITETCAKIGSVVPHDGTKTISLEDIEFVGTAKGRDLQAVVEAGIPVYVSQRAEGTAEIRVWNEDKKPYEHIKTLYGDGWDFIPPGTAGVRDARVQLLLEERRGRQQGKEETVETQEVTTPAAGPTPAPVTLNEEQVRAMLATTLEASEKRIREELEAKLKVAPDSGIEEIKSIREKLNETASRLEASEAEKARLEQEKSNTRLLNEWVQGEDFKRFDEEQKKTLLEITAVSGTEEEVKQRLVEEASKLDKLIASVKLTAMGYATQTPGVSMMPVVNEKFPNYELITKLNEAVEQRLKLDNNGDYAVSGSRERVKKMYLDHFDKMYGAQLYNEAAAVAANVPQIIAYSRVVIEQVFPLMSALDLVDSMTMDAVTQVIRQEVWDQPIPGPLSGAEDLTAMMVGEGGTAPLVSLRMQEYTLYATDRKLGASVTPELLAMTKGIPNYDYTSKLLAGMAKDYARREDQYIYQFIKAASDMQSFVEVTAFENFTQVGSTLEYKSAHQGWIEYEIFSSYNQSNNQPTAILALIGEKVGSIHQKIIIRDNSTVLTRGYLQSTGSITVNRNGTGGAADYYVKYADGSIVLAATPSGTISGKYVYTLNTRFWSQTPASGTFADHLINLGKAVGDVETDMEYRHYTPTRQIASSTVANWIRNSSRFVESLNTAPNTLNSDNSIGIWQGRPLWKSTQMPNDKIILMTGDAITRAVWTPWLIEGPVLEVTTGKKQWIGIEFVALANIVRDKLTSVTITS